MATDTRLADDLETLARQERERLGDPPSAEQLMALHEGQLSDSEAETIRDRLVVDPPLAKAYLDLKRASGRSPEDLSDSATDADVDVAWRQLSGRLQEEDSGADQPDSGSSRVVPLVRRDPGRVLLGLAAVLIAGLGLVSLLRDGSDSLPPTGGEDYVVRVTGETFRGHRVIVPTGTDRLGFHLDIADLPDELAIELLNAKDQSVASWPRIQTAGQTEVVVSVDAASLVNGTYQLRIRTSESVPETDLSWEQRFTLVFAE